MRIFDKKNVILVRVQEEDVNSFVVDVDIDDNGQPLYRLNDLTEAIISVIPEYVFAEYENDSINQMNAVDKLREAARSIYKVKEYDLMRRVYLNNDLQAADEIKESKFINRGEFGELLLHLILREFKGTVPLVSKVYFSDSYDVPAHGFDAVHISKDENILWLGESKLYKTGKEGVVKLIQDIKDHIKTDYLNEQFVIIKKNLFNNSIPERDKWIKQLNSCNKLGEKIRMINIPLLCTYPHDIYKLFDDMNTTEAISYHEMDVKELKAYFDEKNDHSLKKQLNIILILFPIRDKKEFIKKMHERLWHMQSM
ncbi:HamA C-terminal domain-containing protein [Robinsoniella sp. KNHs210]|uniref:HamA C-terminal domain-containing protein n=1 Tax=Robinsoniella sp. KNHs210 TaxID=1469950 RepID=UPI000482DEC2|nr:DUF1837 domain-containing protein [Robinsoniella sp. KNHs210]